MVANITHQEETLFQALKPVVTPLGVDLIDVDIRDHHGDLVVKVVIDSDDGVGIDDCGRISEQVAPVLEVEDPELFQDAQIEVTSPGVDRRLRRPQEFEHYRDREVTVKCYAPFQGRKEWTGTIQSHTDDEITIEAQDNNNDTDGGNTSVSIPLNQVASVRLKFDADEFLSGGNNQDG